MTINTLAGESGRGAAGGPDYCASPREKAKPRIEGFAERKKIPRIEQSAISFTRPLHTHDINDEMKPRYTQDSASSNLFTVNNRKGT